MVSALSFFKSNWRVVGGVVVLLILFLVLFYQRYQIRSLKEENAVISMSLASYKDSFERLKAARAREQSLLAIESKEAVARAREELSILQEIGRSDETDFKNVDPVFNIMFDRLYNAHRDD